LAVSIKLWHSFTGLRQYLFIYISFAHFFLMSFTVLRTIARPVSTDNKPYAYYPRTTMFIANIIRGRNASDKRKKS